MKLFQIVDNFCYYDATPVHPTLADTVGKYPPDVLFVEAPDNVFEGWGYDGVHSSSDAYGRYDAMFDDFYRFVTEGRQNPYTLEYEARLHRILLAACGEQVDYKGEIEL